MKTTDLRIGNLIGIKETALHADGCNHSEAIFEIEEIKKDVVQFKGYHANEYYKDLNPIPLTEQWLLDFGFEICTKSGVHNGWGIGENPLTHDYILFLVWMKNEDGTLAELFYRNGYHTIKYVHQLQNLYFAITREELILKGSEMKYKIKKGNKFLCLKDYVMDIGNIAFTMDEVYISELDGCITDNMFDTNHNMLDEEDFFEHFELIKKPLFVTEDGMEVFDKLKDVISVDAFFNKCTLTAQMFINENRGHGQFKAFYHESNADKYILWNKPLSSLLEIDDAIEMHTHEFVELIKLARERIEG